MGFIFGQGLLHERGSFIFLWTDRYRDWINGGRIGISFDWNSAKFIRMMEYELSSPLVLWTSYLKPPAMWLLAFLIQKEFKATSFQHHCRLGSDYVFFQNVGSPNSSMARRTLE